MSPMMTTSDELRAWRSARRWTQQQAADELDYSLRAYAEYEKPDKAVPKWLALAITALPLDKPVVRSVHGTTIGDLSDEDNVRQTDHELKRATTDAALADWARRWGECAVERMRAVAEIEADGEERERDHREALAERDREIENLTETVEALKIAGRAVCDAFDCEDPDVLPIKISALEALL